MELLKEDLEFLQEKGITEEKLTEQLEMLREGFPFLKIERAATPGHGISVMSPEMQMGAIRCWDEFLAKGGRVMKMVPASGAASRMFKDLFAFLNGKSDKPDNDFIKKFFDHIEEFAFYERLNFVCLGEFGKSIDTLIKEKRYKDIVDMLIEKVGLRYGQLPKALLQFHKTMGGSRTALEEHLAEGAQYSVGKDETVHIHFTVSEEHIPLVKMKVEETAGRLGHEYGVNYDITYSVQKPSTDTVAANLDGTPYREKGHLFFRPGGHGALIENLNELDADVIFIKNIDNVVPDTHRGATIQYKKVLGGTLVAVKQRIDEYCRLLSENKADDEKVAEIIDFLHNVLCITHDSTDDMTPEQKREYAYKKLNRPVRVCGMVRNEGEPGGGPFLAYNPDGTVSPQILESSQIDMKDGKSEKMMKESTHFNPVDLAVSVRNWKGEKFNLPEYVDKATGFISQKSREGVEIKALELPGLWNGAMSDWNTLFIEVPAQTFNPVKTVNDLLRQAHQPLPQPTQE
ncbi:MAG: DUF4301 family protein [Muribaculaceae bacterium]|nr:DUF4301 family protein [Muribaculaceae bacterium]